MSYHVYENWQAGEHKAKIHYSNCSFCNNGAGIHPGSSNDNGQWHGPFNTMQQAVVAANATGGNVTPCQHCQPV